MIVTPIGFYKAPPSGGGFDPDAQAYITAVETAGGTLSAGRKSAINTLFTDLKSAGLYSNMNALWPMMGGTTGSAAIEAKGNSAYNITFNGGMTVDATGAAGNGTNGYVTFGALTSDDLTLNSYSIGFNQVTSNTPTKNEELMFGNYYDSGVLPIVEVATNLTSASNIAFIRSGSLSTGVSSSANTPAAGSYILNRNASNSSSLFKNGSSIATVSGSYTITGSSPLIGYNAWILGSPYSNGYANQKVDLWFWSEGLTAGQVTSLTQIMQDWTTNIQ